MCAPLRSPFITSKDINSREAVILDQHPLETALGAALWRKSHIVGLTPAGANGPHAPQNFGSSVSLLIAAFITLDIDAYAVDFCGRRTPSDSVMICRSGW